MTLVYAKIIGMFVCGAEPWGRGGGWGLGGTWKFPKLSPTHRWLSVGGGGVYIHTYIMYVHTFLCHKVTLKFQVDLDPWALDPPIFTQKPLKTVTSHLYHLQITLKSVDISIFGLK